MIASTEPYQASGIVTLTDKPFDRISWGAIFAGALTALSVQLVLSLIGLGIGLSTIDARGGDNPDGATVGIGAVIWWTLSSLISLYVGGMIAGRTAGTFNGYFHGLITWATVTVAMVLILSSAVGGAFRGVTGLAQFTVQQFPQLRQQAPDLVENVQAQTRDAVNQAENAAKDPVRQQQMQENADRAAKGGAMGTIGAAIALLLGAIAASYGGHHGRKTFLENVARTSTDEAPTVRR